MHREVVLESKTNTEENRVTGESWWPGSAEPLVQSCHGPPLPLGLSFMLDSKFPIY